MADEGRSLELLRRAISPYVAASDGQLLQLVAHNKLVARWNGVVNLTRIVDLREAATRHYGESAILAGAIGPWSFSVVDVGSGAGFPGIPLAVLLPRAAITLVEADQRKGAFLKEACRSLGNCTVQICRSDALEGRFDWVVSRAVKWADVERAAWRLSKSVAILAGDEFPESKLVQWREQRAIPWGQRRAILIGQVVPRETIDRPGTN